MADASPKWLPEDSMTMSASTAAMATASSPFRTASAPTARAISSGLSCMSTATIRDAPLRFSTATAKAPIGPLPITRQSSRQHPRRALRRVGDARRFHEGGCPEVQVFRQGPQHAWKEGSSSG